MSTTATQTSTNTTRLTADNTSSSTKPSSSISATNVTPEKKQDPEEELDIYDEIEIEDMTYDAALRIYHYPCPCGDRFEISVDAMRDSGDDIAVCPGCSLMVRVVFEVEDLPKEGG